MSQPRTTRISKSLLLMLLCGLVVGVACFLVGLIIGGHQSAAVRYGKPLSFYHSHSEEAVVPAPVQNLPRPDSRRIRASGGDHDRRQ